MSEDWLANAMPRRLSDARLASLLTGWAQGDGPLYRQLTETLQRLLELGDVPPAVKLPSERALAEALSISRTTVVNAYTLLKETGWLESRQGSGTWTQRAVGPKPGVLLAEDEDRLSGYAPHLPTMIDFSSAAVPGLSIVTETATSLRTKDLAELVAADGYIRAGLPQLREAIAHWLTEQGVPTTSGEILVTSGAQQGLELVAMSTLNPGDSVVVENPTYRGALQAFGVLGVRLVPVPVDERGASLTALERALERSNPAAVYLLPTAHNPTGAVTPDSVRAQVATLTARRDILLIDDASPADTLFRGEMPPLLASYAPEARSVTIGSFSKSFWGGLRVGWVRAPAPMIGQFSRVKRGVTELGTSLVSQLIALRLLPRIEEARSLRRRQLAAGYGEVTELLSSQLPSWTWQRSYGGASLWVRLPHGTGATFSQIALRHGVALVPGPIFSADQTCEQNIRLSFAQRPAVLRSGVRRLALAWDSYQSQASSLDAPSSDR